ncbi:MAG: double-strand break repair helicase AddA [Alphaproteobacteria bacterium]|nr:double-strand break repair helicase AddA [Alphaproteobacteria bacterium]
MIKVDWKTEKKRRGKLATEQQHLAAQPHHSVWVEASAGTGKTQVLSDRVLRLLLNGVSPAKLLCITYTKAAAVEMNSRISQKLSQWAVVSEEELDTQLEQLLGKLPDNKEDYCKLVAVARRLFAVLLDTPGGMKIQTLHSFCQEILKRFPLEAKVSPYFEVMDDRAKSEILESIKNKMLATSDVLQNKSVAEAIGYLTSHVYESAFSEVMSVITNNAGKIVRLFANYPHNDDLFAELAKRLDVAPTLTEDEVKRCWLDTLDVGVLRQMVIAWQQGSVSDKDKANMLAPLLESSLMIEDYDNFHQIFLNKNGSLPAKYATKKVLEIYPALQKEASVVGESLIATDEKLAGVRLFASTKAVIFLSKELIETYQQYKFEHAKMDYDDLIILTKQLLEDKSVADWVLFKLDGGIDHVLIDEAQDTSPNQWGIVRSLTQAFFDGSHDNRTVFVVGDRKQSIYSFQGADPREFDKMRQYFKAHAPQFDEVNLDISFRSTAAILDSVNTIFQDETARQGVVPQGQELLHVPYRGGEGGRVEVWPLLEAEPDENPETWLPPVEPRISISTSSRLAKMIVQRIKHMVEKEELSSQGRKFQYRDFMILVQRRNAFVEEFVQECKAAGVEIAGADRIKLSQQVAVQDLLALGKFLLLPTDDLTLAEVLKSPLFGLDDNDLFKLCYHRGATPLWTRLCDNPAYKTSVEILQQLLNMADYVRPYELYSYVLGKLGGRRKFEERMTNEVHDGLDEFLTLTLTFEQEHIPTLQGFISWMAQDEVEIKRELEQGDMDAVRIMTVHGSKGLQAPVVILPDTVRVVNAKKEMGMLWDDLFYFPLSSGDYDKRCLKIKEQEKQDALEEYRRLLYVALTRARDYLFICGYCQNTQPKDDCWYNLCSRSLEKIATKQDGMLIYDVPQQIEVSQVKEPVVTIKDFTLPSWAREIPLAESPLAKPYTPSQPDETDDEDALFSPLLNDSGHRYRRGIVIHKLLQFLPDVQTGDKLAVIREYLRQNAADFNLARQEKIVQEVYDLVTDSRFAPLFAASSKAEVPIMGEVDGRIISAQIDRLVVLDDAVWIVDYKTNRPAAHTADEVQHIYIKQLAAYKALMEKIYPQKKVKTFILWTDTAQIMPIEI